MKQLLSIILYLDFDYFLQTFIWQGWAFTESYGIYKFITGSRGFSEFPKEDGAQDIESIPQVFLVFYLINIS